MAATQHTHTTNQSERLRRETAVSGVIMPQDALIGTQIEAYQIKAAIGEGGMARVYRAYHDRLQRDVALKVILPHLLDQGQHQDKAEFIERFKREALLIAKLEHPNIVSVYDFGEARIQGETLTYLVMQYVGGGTLRSYMHDGQPVDPRRATRYILQMARALHHAHLRGIVHRDIKPQNMLVSSSDQNHLLLSDFGIAKLFSTHDEAPRATLAQAHANPALTQIGQIVGTAAYMAPEQFNEQPVDARSDIYALGVVLYQMLAGQRPFQAENFTGFQYQHTFQPPAPIRVTNPQVPEILEQITFRALAKRPEQRFQAAEEMADALEQALTTLSQPSSAMPQLSSNASALTIPSHLSARATQPSYSTAQALPSSPGAYIQAGALTTPQYQSHRTPVTGQGAMPQTNSYQAPPQTHQPRRTPAFKLSTVMTVIFILLAIVLVATNVLPRLGVSLGWPTSPSTQGVQAFTDTFKSSDNPHGWPEGDLNATTGSLSSTGYNLAVHDSNTHFPAPQASGTLPDNFTWTVTLHQEAGTQERFYGIAFHLSYSGSNVQSCYALIIDGEGGLMVLRYDSNNGIPTPNTLWSSTAVQAIHTGLNADNTLQVIAHGSIYSFKVNNTPITLANHTTSISDSHYTAGQIGLLVTGKANNQDQEPGYVATYAQLTLP
ncbi:hypothetical protein KSB_36830 [Ktedonobacter robiniae]|uniref:non-specific serine/threonine protein kinase n=2 Tax=Ktedonobacter robiniae TaxID=2778365 RepID=A0ABQ3UR40_9CHLR|nr:hypothetical protein KSB_36830 [Ktedonobacter robiniae]